MLIIALAHVYVGWSLVPELPTGQWVRVTAFAVLILSIVIIPARMVVRVYAHRHVIIDRVSWVSSLTMGWFSSLFVLTLLRDLVLLLPHTDVRAGDSAVFVVGASVVLTIVGYFNARRLAGVVRVSIPVDNLPDALQGFTIVQITDMHIGPTIKAPYVRSIVGRVNALQADVVAITGDIVDGPLSHLSGDTAPLADIQARYGAYVVTGNHEYYAGADEWIEEFRRLGLRLLLNEHVVLEHNNAEIIIAGVNDYSAARVHVSHVSDPAAALAGSPENTPKILLAHQPRSAYAAARAGFDLQLSGHTHGGQFWPWNHFVRIQQPFTSGLHRLDNLWVYTSRGTGYWGPPKRLGARSEITLIKLVPTP